MSASAQSGGGIGICGALTVLFVGLKLTNYIAWSWWWVLAPVWLPVTLVLGIMGVMFFVATRIK